MRSYLVSTRHDNPLRLVAYARVSTNGQAIKGESPAAQEEAIRSWAAEHGHEIVAAMADNGVSGKVDADDRPGLAAALIEVEDGRADGVVVRELDRLARKLHVQEAALERVWAAGGRVFEVAHSEVPKADPGDPMRTFIREVMGSAARRESGMIRLRLERARVRPSEQGHYVAGFQRKYGYRLVQQDGKQRLGAGPR
jgi:DNA invertase Pin-like site-specific DNA recombinase